MIQVENLVKTFDGFRALDGADFHVKKGAIYGLVGPNGAGKSTLIRHLTGIYKQDEGSVLIDGEPVFENSAVKEKIAYIPDDLFYFAQADTMEGLKSSAGYIRKLLASNINLRNTPEIQFILDQSIEYGVRMSKMIDEVTKDIKEKPDEEA